MLGSITGLVNVSEGALRRCHLPMGTHTRAWGAPGQKVDAGPGQGRPTRLFLGKLFLGKAESGRVRGGVKRMVGGGGGIQPVLRRRCPVPSSQPAPAAPNLPTCEVLTEPTSGQAEGPRSQHLQGRPPATHRGFMADGDPSSPPARGPQEALRPACAAWDGPLRLEPHWAGPSSFQSLSSLLSEMWVITSSSQAVVGERSQAQAHSTAAWASSAIRAAGSSTTVFTSLMPLRQKASCYWCRLRKESREMQEKKMKSTENGKKKKK